MQYYLVSEKDHPTRRYRALHHWHAAEIHARRRHGRRATAERVTGDATTDGLWLAYVPFPAGGLISRGNPYRVIEDEWQVPHSERGDLPSYNW